MLVISDNEEYYGNLENLEKKMSQVLEKKNLSQLLSSGETKDFTEKEA